MIERVLITGGGGQLGMDLAQVCERSGDEVLALDKSQLDITELSAIGSWVTQFRPSIVVNCAAWTAVDACEADPDLADLVNGTALEGLREAAASVGAHVVQISTDYVFDGTKPDPYVENDPPNPQSAYGRSKLLGEQFAGPESTVVRTSWVFSAHGRNMVETILRIADGAEPMRFVDDQVGCPTWTGDLAVAIRNVAADRRAGIVHCTNDGAVSWFEFARCVLTAAGLDTDRVEPIATAELNRPRAAVRPANSVLANHAYRLNYDALPDFRARLEGVVEAYR